MKISAAHFDNKNAFQKGLMVKQDKILTLSFMARHMFERDEARLYQLSGI